jgi:hypothetical protein
VGRHTHRPLAAWVAGRDASPPIVRGVQRAHKTNNLKIPG